LVDTGKTHWRYAHTLALCTHAGFMHTRWLYAHTLALCTRAHARAHTRARARRYQVGFSGDVHELTWSNLAYQPYFSVRVQRQQALAPAVAL
jgi:hypothetical protein